MKNIFKIYKRDIVNISKNYMAIIIALGLCILPSLYAWFNIKASWDPYSNTKGVSVAIVNLDKGTNFNGEDLHLGDDIVDELKKNDAIGWKFVDEAQGEYGLIHNEYYARIVIPEDFSKNITSFISNEPVKPQLLYTVNEKRNAVAPKITKSGASALKETVSENFIKMVNGVIFSTFDEIGVELQDQRPNLDKLATAIIKLDDNMDKITSTVNEFYDGSITLNEVITKFNSDVPLVEDSLNSANDVLNTADKFVDNVNTSVNQLAPMVKDSLQFASNIAHEVQDTLNNNFNNLPSGERVVEVLTNVKSYLSVLQGKVDSTANLLDKFSKLNPDLKPIAEDLKKLSASISSLNSYVDTAINNVNTNGTISQEVLNNLRTKANEVTKFIDDKLVTFDTVIKPEFDAAVAKVTSISNNAKTVIGDAQKSMPDIKKLLNLGIKGSDIAEETLGTLKDKLPEIRPTLHKVADKTRELQSTGKLDELIDLLINDPDVIKSFISTPVELTESKVYPVPNYGSAMSPFFTSLSLWVGVLILSSILTVEAAPFNDGTITKPYEEFLGKYLLFFTLAVIQSLIVTIGDKYLLGCYISNFRAFVISGVIISISFSMIVYTLVSLFGNVGKAIGVIILVLQISASGGTFPIEVTPPFFQAINPFLPFTYAVGAMRECVAGIFRENLFYDLGILAALFFGFLFVGLLLKKPFHKITHKLNKKFHESGISE